MKTIALVFLLSLGAKTINPVLAQETPSVDQAQEQPQPAESILALIDVPLMDGFEELTEEGVLFDKPDGRYVEVTLTGDVALNVVQEFYRLTLKEWGWVMVPDSRDENLHYIKEDEDLGLNFSFLEGSTYIKIRLKPAS